MRNFNEMNIPTALLTGMNSAASRAKFAALVATFLGIAMLVPVASFATLPRGFAGVLADGPAIDGTVSFDAQVKAMKRNSVGWIRLPVYWSQIELQKGQFDFTVLDSEMKAAAASGIPVMPVVLGAPAWAAAPPEGLNSHPSDVADYGHFLAVLAVRYGTHGSYWSQQSGPSMPITKWQIWNEPDLDVYWRADGRSWEFSYVPLLRAARVALAGADPKARVVLAGLSNYSWLSLGRLYRDGGRGLFDYAALNPFSNTAAGVLEIVRRSRVVMSQHGDSSKPLIISEVAWSSGKGLAKQKFGWETTESGQAAQLTSLMRGLELKRKAYRLDGVAWATWLSPALGSPWSFDYSGLNRLVGSKVVAKPALTAFRNSVSKR